ncbi:hypothetical protein V1477_007738, partial [Vespula maculifrons]
MTRRNAGQGDSDLIKSAIGNLARRFGPHYRSFAAVTIATATAATAAAVAAAVAAAAAAAAATAHGRLNASSVEGNRVGVTRETGEDWLPGLFKKADYGELENGIGYLD